jgi:hypothetical protein
MATICDHLTKFNLILGQNVKYFMTTNPISMGSTTQCKTNYLFDVWNLGAI